MFERDRSSQALGIVIAEVTAGGAVATMTVRDDMVNGLGVCHGGYLFTLADTAMAYASNSRDDVAFAVAAQVDFLRPARAGDRLTARATERDRAGRTALTDVEVATGDGTVVAVFRGRTRTTGQPVVGK
jgi:acyl-CoA thioesterase